MTYRHDGEKGNHMKVNNVSENAKKYPWMVVRVCEGEYWYYGSWNSFDKAAAQAAEVGGCVVPSDSVEV